MKKEHLLATLDLVEVEAHVKQAKNGFLKAKRYKQRVEKLYKDRAATLEQLQDVKTAFEMAESQLAIASFNLDHSKIYAPTDGKILKRLAQENEMISPGYPVFFFGSTNDQWVIKAGLAERDIVKLQLNDRADIKFDPYPGKIFSAHVSEISEALDPASGTYEVEITLHKEDGFKLISGFVGKTDIHLSSSETFFVIPVDALAEGEGTRGVVFTVKNNTAQKVSVTVAYLFSDKVAVRSGLQEVKEVITSGVAYLTDGAKVKIEEL